MIFVCISFALCMYAVLSGGMLWGLPCVALCLAVWVVGETLRLRREHIQELKRYATQTDNEYVYSEYVGDPTVRQRADQARALIEESGNQTNIQVIEIYANAGAYVNESWEDFEARREAIIAEDKKKRHTFLESKHRDFYLTHTLKQY